jgi:formamidopyrimidine-DNA glycosylase
MPELPDVEIFRGYFEKHAIEQEISGVRAEEETLEGISEKDLRSILKGGFFHETARRGKFFFARFTPGDKRKKDRWLVVHFGMTGYFRYLTRDEEEPRNTRMLISFKGGARMAWSCQRKLGRVRIREDMEAFIKCMDLGPDALDKGLTKKAFQERLAKKRGYIKSALMDQSLIAGLGNVYVDEILYRAGLHPRHKSEDLSDKMLADLYKAMRRVLEAAVEAGADPDRMPSDFLLPRRGTEKACACGGPVEKIKVSGRNGYYCPNCQA